MIIQCKLDEKQRKELECQLHAADHNKLNEITVGLLASANHLVWILYTLKFQGFKFRIYWLIRNFKVIKPEGNT